MLTENRMEMGRSKKSPIIKKILSIFIIIGYLVLLTPFIIASNSGESGFIQSSQEIAASNLPSDIQDYIRYKDLKYNMILIEDPITNIKTLQGGSSKEKKLVLSIQTGEKNDFIRVDNQLLNIFAPQNLIITDQNYDKLIIGDTKKAAFGGIIEIINNLGLRLILIISQIIYYTGGILIVFILTMLFNKRLALWNIPAIVTCYSFQFFLASRIASANHLETDFAIVLFGFLFIPALLLTFWVKKFEETDEGRQYIYNIYKNNVNFLRTLKSQIKFPITFK